MSGRKPTYAGGAVARYLMFGSAIALMIGGLVMVFSASYVADMVNTGSMFYHGLRQAIYITLGLAVALVLSRFDYRRLQNSSKLVWWASIGLLADHLCDRHRRRWRTTVDRPGRRDAPAVRDREGRYGAVHRGARRRMAAGQTRDGEVRARSGWCDRAARGDDHRSSLTWVPPCR